ncbi:MAG: diaminopimelate decarboxylase [Blastopirellula sp.]|nr:MAG: diaminopimelate decarboxylase [Blastopirellula sp.]
MIRAKHTNTSQVDSIIENYFSTKQGELCIGKIPISELAHKYGTPFYVYDQRVMEHKLDVLQKTFKTDFEIYYSIKANPNQHILRLFIERGCGLEIASGGELFQALKANCPANKIIFAGPGKCDDELEYAIENNVGEIHVESLCEAKRISAISHQFKKTTPIALRINPSGDAQGGAMRMGGKAAPFGIDEEVLAEVLDQVSVDPNLEVVGIHLFTGTQILDHTVLATQYRKAVAIAKRVATQLNRPLKTIDFGGGLGIPYFTHENPLDLDAFSISLSEIVEEIKNDRFLAPARLMIEPGRFLVGESGIYVSRVNQVKTSRGKQFVIVDGGMHHHLAASGNLGQTIKRNYPVSLVTKLNRTDREPVDVVGPLCTPLDVLARNVSLPHAEVGDLFAVFQSGAYGRSASPLGFLSHNSPPEVWVNHDTDKMIRQRGKFSDLLIDQG